jgi:hypothetical protein
MEHQEDGQAGNDDEQQVVEEQRTGPHPLVRWRLHLIA